MVATAHRLIGLVTQTPLHAGAGSATEVIDLPIQREAHTDWPCVFGSSMKGALRAAAESYDALDKERITTLFGPDTANASEHAGNLLVSDARLLLLPVRSLTGHYRWVTCPALLRRLMRDAQRCGVMWSAPSIPTIEEGEAWVLQHKGEGNTLFLEEFSFSTRTDSDGLTPWLTLLNDLLDDRKEELHDQLTLVDDASFRHLCRSAIPVQPHIRIKNETKTVADGALWYEENISPDTLFYWTLTAQPSRNAKDEGAPDAMLESLLSTLFPVNKAWLQVGGNETVGMGWCQVKEVRNGQV
ncbi:type III-B CRISPR module RAMP protein Cmr4 [Halomonas meridiana]|uniref:type III-B CRISPR module RAMP protein Cmr4 n=1 Tax=Halomonadaceae TaxID=28256 RepID=UPI0019D2ADCA|nr:MULTISPECIES: type III-B CRISPR module RAMP protein Cmr4 [Halomonas]MDP4559170.1 type III-B CRISPR module RAMP protein Cmr4 [Halomonas meridiana]